MSWRPGVVTSLIGLLLLRIGHHHEQACSYQGTCYFHRAMICIQIWFIVLAVLAYDLSKQLEWKEVKECCSAGGQFLGRIGGGVVAYRGSAA